MGRINFDGPSRKIDTRGAGYQKLIPLAHKFRQNRLDKKALVDFLNHLGNNYVLSDGISGQLQSLETPLEKLAFLKQQKVIHLNRYSDNWSQGPSGGVIIISKKAEEKNLTFTVFKGRKIVIKVNGKIQYQKHFSSTGKLTQMLVLPAGINFVELNVDESFIPNEEIPKNSDIRALGMNFEIEPWDRNLLVFKHEEFRSKTPRA